MKRQKAKKMAKSILDDFGDALFVIRGWRWWFDSLVVATRRASSLRRKVGAEMEEGRGRGVVQIRRSLSGILSGCKL